MFRKSVFAFVTTLVFAISIPAALAQRQTQHIQVGSPIHAMDWSDVHNLLAVATEDDSLARFDLPSGAISDTEPITRLAIQVTGQYHWRFYNVTEAGKFEALEDFTRLFADIIEQGWFPWRHDEEMLISPDGRFIAFMSYRFASHESESGLFLYEVGNYPLRKVETEGIGRIHWSPNSDAILVIAPDDEPDGVIPRVSEIMLYSLTSDTLTAVTHSPDDLRRRLMWLPDNQHFVFSNRSTPCLTSCTGSVDNLYLSALGGTSQIALTHLESQIQANTLDLYSHCYPIQLVWNDAQSHVYYVVRCMDGDSHQHDMIFSVSSKGDNRLEADLPALYPDASVTIIDKIYLSPEDHALYVVAYGEARFIPNNPQPRMNHWRVLRIDQPESLSTIYAAALTDVQMLTGSAMSSNGEHMALVGLDYLREIGLVKVIRLSDSQVTFERESDKPLCGVQWESRQTLYYHESPEVTCVGVGKTWKLNIDDHRIIELTQGLAGTMWILEIP